MSPELDIVKAGAEAPHSPSQPQKTAALAAKAIAAISQGLNILGMVMLGGLVGITVVDVLGRSLFHKPILGTFEITEYMLAVIVFCTIAWCAVTKSHIVVDIVTSHLGHRLNTVVSVFINLIGLGLLLLIMWESFHEALVIGQMGKASTMLNIPAAPFYWLMAIGFLVVSLQMLVELVRSILKAVSK